MSVVAQSPSAKAIASPAGVVCRGVTKDYGSGEFRVRALPRRRRRNSTG